AGDPLGLTLVGAEGLKYANVFTDPALPSSPQFTTGGGVLRLVWINAGLKTEPTTIFARRFSAAGFVEELPGEASGRGASLTAVRATSLAAATDAAGRTTLVWQDSLSGGPEIHARGMTATVGRAFVADESTSIQSILDTEALGAGDVIVVKATKTAWPATLTAADKGVTIWGAAGALIGAVTVEAGADDVLIQRVTSRFSVTVNGANRFTLSESTVNGVVLNGGSAAQIVASRVSGSQLPAAIAIRGGVSDALIDRTTVFAGAGATGIEVVAVGGVAATNLAITASTIQAGTLGTAVALRDAATGRIRGNTISAATGTGLEIAAAFTGPIEGNTVSGSGVGIAYRAAAALAGNTVTKSAVGIRTTVAGAVDGLGFVAGSGVNDVVGNTVGVEAVAAQFQRQRIADNITGARGSGTIGGTSLDTANLFVGNRTAVTDFTGTVQYGRFTRNLAAAIDVTAAMGGLVVRHNAFNGNPFGVRVQGASGVEITQNTFFTTGDNVRVQGASANVSVVANVMWTKGGYDIFVANDSQAGFWSDFNTLYATGNGKIGYWTKDFTDILDWQADIARFDLHSVGATKVNPAWAKPRFFDAVGDDLRIFEAAAGLRFTSPSDNGWFQGEYVGTMAAALITDQGANGAATLSKSTDTARKIMLRSPDLYVDWETDVTRAIRWQTVNNASSLVRIDLLQDSADGPAFLANITAGTTDDGEFLWRPADSGIAAGTKGLRIQVSLVADPGTIDRSQETFTVPEAGPYYFVNDLSLSGDQYTTAVGDNRNTGRLPDAPKPNPTNLMRAYDLAAGDLLRIDTGSYPMIDPFAVTGGADIAAVAGPATGIDEGFTAIGPVPAVGSVAVARLFPAIPGDRSRPLVYVRDTDDVTIRNLLLENAQSGLVVVGARNFAAAGIAATGHAADGIAIETLSPLVTFENLYAANNGGDGIDLDGNIGGLAFAAGTANAGHGVAASGTIGLVTDVTATDNAGFGIFVENAGGLVLQKSLVARNLAGIWVTSLSPTATAVVGSADLATGKGNVVFGNTLSGIRVVDATATVAGNTVGATLHANAWGIQATGSVRVMANVVAGNTRGVSITGGEVRGNRVYANTGDGIFATDATVAENVVYSNVLGLRLASAAALTAANNIVYANRQAGVQIGGTGVSFVNNTVYEEVGDAVRIEGATDARLFNNALFARGGRAIFVTADARTGFASDRNLFVPSPTGAVGSWQGVAAPTLAAWQAAAAVDAASISA
ncbi:MAG: beta strand repeat-containing protein, partial [Planctomycetia bacterium]